VNFFLDIGCACLSIGSDLIYIFGVIAVFSLLCFGAILSGVQEEQKNKIRLTYGWIVSAAFLQTLISSTFQTIKAILLVVLFISAAVAFHDLDWVVGRSKLLLTL
jgi:hypothetical protein